MYVKHTWNQLLLHCSNLNEPCTAVLDKGLRFSVKPLIGLSHQTNDTKLLQNSVGKLVESLCLSVEPLIDLSHHKEYEITAKQQLVS